ncbi:unnamed protein product, partial [Angiostrongylus costaricensis]|uniref:RRM domain-containing protein n=1 Tax=Angiostrongylus costaricensis TaxID=334426 RepID=A0A0R3PEM7_ANGCS
ADEEHEELQKALRKFEDDFGSLGGGALDRGPKAFIRSEVVNIATVKREIKRLIPLKARRMLEEAHKGKGPPPQVIPSSATRPVLRPPKPGAGRAVQKSKTSNLEAFKEELKKVQQERDQRKGLRDHLRAELGVDAEALDKSIHGFLIPIFFIKAFYLRICSMTMEDLFDTFGSFGPLASAKILFPRTEEEKRREHLCGFCAFMSREDVDRALAQMMGFFIRGEPIRMSFAKPIVIPAQVPLFFHMLHFLFCSLKHELYVLSTLTTCGNIVLWFFSHLLLVIQHVVEFTVREGPLFEAMLMTRERTNPLFRFLFELNHPTHVYYRWRLYSISQGDTFLEWHREKFRMFEGGSWWQPPIPQAELFSSMPRSLYSFACTMTEPSRWLPKLDTRTSSKSQDTRERQDRSRSSPRREQLKKPKARLRKSQRKKLEQLLRELTPESDSIGDAMVWCADHATCAREICDCIYESLTIDETPLHKKIQTRLLEECETWNLFDFKSQIIVIFSALGRTLRNITARLKAEQFKQRVMSYEFRFFSKPEKVKFITI